MTTRHPGEFEWQPGEREQSEREITERAAEIADRQRKIDAAEMLRWARDHQAERNAVTPEDCAPPRRRSAAPAAAPTASADVARKWQAYIRQEVASAERAMMKAFAQVLVAEERQREALERRCERLEAELAELRTRLDQERGQRGLRAVPSDGTSLIA